MHGCGGRHPQAERVWGWFRRWAVGGHATPECWGSCAVVRGGFPAQGAPLGVAGVSGEGGEGTVEVGGAPSATLTRALK